MSSSGPNVGWTWRERGLRILLVVVLPASLANIALALLRSADFYFTLMEELLWIWGVRVELMPRLGIIDVYFLAAEGLILLFSIWFVSYKEGRAREVRRRFRPRWLELMGLTGLALLIFFFFLQAPNSRLVTDYIYAAPPGSSSSLVSIIFEVLVVPWLPPAWRMGWLQSWRAFSIVMLNSLMLGSVATPVIRYGQLRLLLLPPQDGRHGDGGQERQQLAICLERMRMLLRAYLGGGTVARFTIVGIMTLMVYLLLVFPVPPLPSPHYLDLILAMTVGAYTGQGPLTVQPHNILGITGLVWLSSMGFFAATSELPARVVMRYLWDTRKDELVIVGVAMMVSMALTPLLAGSWTASLAAGIGASLPLHRTIIRSFAYFDNMAEEYVGYAIHEYLSNPDRCIMVVGGGRIGRAVLADLIPFQKLSEEFPGYLRVWSGGPAVRRLQRGRRHYTYLVEGVVVLDPSELIIRQLGEHPQLGPYGCLEFPLTRRETGELVDVVVPAIMAEAGLGRTPGLAWASVVVMAADNPRAAHMLLEEMAQLPSGPGGVRPAFIVRGTGAAQIFQLVRRGRQLGIPVVHVYFEREIGYHLGLALMLGSESKTRRSRTGGRRGSGKAGGQLLYDYLLVCDGRKRIYYVLEALYLHGLLEPSGLEVEGIPILRVCIVTTSPALLQRCVTKRVGEREMILYPAIWSLEEGERSFYIPVIPQKRSYPLIKRLINRHPFRGILVAEGQVHETFSAVASIAAALERKTGRRGRLPIVVVSANGEPDLVGAHAFLRRAGIPHYVLNWLDFVSGQVNSVLRLLRAEPGFLDLDRLMGTLAPLVGHPATGLYHRLYCPVAALHEKLPVSEALGEATAAVSAPSSSSKGRAEQQLEGETKRESWIAMQRLTASAGAIYMCTPDRVGITKAVCSAIRGLPPDSKLGRVAEPYVKRVYSLLALCFDEYPGSFVSTLQRTLGIGGHEFQSTVTQGLEQEVRGEMDLSFLATFDCGLDNRVCLSLFLHRTSPVEHPRGHPLRCLVILSPSGEVDKWCELLDVLPPQFRRGELDLPGGLRLLTAQRSDVERLHPCLDGSCPIRNLQWEIREALCGEKPSSARLQQGERDRPTKHNPPHVNLHFMQMAICTSPPAGKPCARLVAFANLLD